MNIPTNILALIFVLSFLIVFHEGGHYAIAKLLRQAEAYGRVAVDLWMLLPSDDNVHEQQIDKVPRELYVARELTVPADEDEVDGLALSWHRELQRAMGIVKYEDDQTR